MGSLIEDLVSRDAILAELACIVSDPGQAQASSDQMAFTLCANPG